MFLHVCVCQQGGVRGRGGVSGGGCMVGGHVWWGEHAWQGGHAWQGVYMVGGMHGGCMTGGVWQGGMHGGAMRAMADSMGMGYGQWAGGTHPTGMHSCFQIISVAYTGFSRGSCQPNEKCTNVLFGKNLLKLKKIELRGRRVRSVPWIRYSILYFPQFLMMLRFWWIFSTVLILGWFQAKDMRLATIHKTYSGKE